MYLHSQFEDSSLFLSKEDGDFLNERQSVWILYDDRIDKAPNQPLEYFDCMRVLVRGHSMRTSAESGVSSRGYQRRANL